MYYFIVNTSGGSGRTGKIWADISRKLKSECVEYKAFRTKGPGDAARIAGAISRKNGEKKLIVVGGDGTINEVLNGIEDFDNVKFAAVPTGSGNDFVRGLGMPKNHMEVLERILSGQYERCIDLGRIVYPDGSSRIFGISAGAGMDAIVCKKALTSKIKTVLNKIGLGSLTYMVITVMTLFSMDYLRGRAILTDENGNTNEINLEKMIFMAAMNMKAEGGGVKMAPDAENNDGMLSICIANGIPKLTAFTKFPLLVFGKHTGMKGFILENCKKAEVYLEKKTVAHTDGEYAGDLKKMTFEVLENKLNCII